MIVDIGNILKGKLEPYLIGGSAPNPFIDVLAGVVKVVSKSDVTADNKTVRKSFPISCDVSQADCFETGRYRDLIPNSKKGCIIYFEDVANNFVRQDGALMVWRAQLRLVCWLNQKVLGTDDCFLTSKVIQQCILAFPEFHFNSGNHYQQLLITVLGQDPKNFNPFSKYSYDEDKSQFLMYPYDYFSLPISVDYAIHKSCITPFVKNDENAC